MAQAIETEGRLRRRTFTAAEKLRVLREADRCKKRGDVEALLRKESLRSSHLSAWRRARESGEIAGLSPRQRGPRSKSPDPRDKHIATLERRMLQLETRLQKSEARSMPAKKRPRCDSPGPGTDSGA